MDRMLCRVYLTALLLLCCGTLCATQLNVTSAAPASLTTGAAKDTTTIQTSASPNTTTAAATTIPLTTANATTLTTHNTTITTTQAHTTHGNTSSHAPTTHSTTHASTTSTVPTPPPLPQPSTGEYRVNQTDNSTCLMANMGLQISYKQGETFESVNLEPNGTTASGNCGKNNSESSLTLHSPIISILFVFKNVSSKFWLHSFNATVKRSGVDFSDGNLNLSLWKASFGSSYMCRKEQSYNITDTLVLHTFDLRIQPFAVVNDRFSTAEECFLDSDLSFLVPIAVGVALSFLIILVLISYLIGRRKSRTGYQSV
ncbi:lysosome-associated membrane glycoprotein 2 isoform X2 [Denticeps clupeoides]|uniref:lysosome-associated membrane glycoprotein 2 isoform X2 n=1 Tax=Denticeps clupeoides TaxID=299321 RepID=UPI0010A2E18A|nr:lysosome-associated membrane glycoprotein 2-like isoform X2 [Denticeps clupeoides]